MHPFSSSTTSVIRRSRSASCGAVRDPDLRRPAVPGGESLALQVSAGDLDLDPVVRVRGRHRHQQRGGREQDGEEAAEQHPVTLAGGPEVRHQQDR
jgi:hypothetical protein